MKHALRNLILLLLCASAHAEEPLLLATIKPVGWILEALAPAGARIEVLLPASQSPHHYQLRPLDVARIHNSTLNVWVGPGLEPWFAHAARALPASQHFALLTDTGNEHEHDETEFIDINADPHLWLDPVALRMIAPELAARLQQIYPAQTEEIQQNLARFEKLTQALDMEMHAVLTPVQQQGFIVYHDGYQRMVQRYHLNQRAAVWHHENIAAGARARATLIQLLNSGDIRCLFYEPEHGADAVRGWLGAAATHIKLAELDPLGEKLPPGPDSYPRFMRALATQIAECLR